MPSAISRDEADRLATELTVLAEPHRLLVLSDLRNGARSAGWLARAIGMAPSLASHHLSVLLRADLVSRWREGSFVYYTLNRQRAGEIQQALTKLTRAPSGARGGTGNSRSRADEPDVQAG